MSGNSNLHAAKAAKNDEFYTRAEDVEAEMWNYRKQFRGKAVHCDCDDPDASEIVDYFRLRFERLGLKRLHVTGYRQGTSEPVEMQMLGEGDGMTLRHEIESGDFRSEAVAEVRDMADIVVTNPPFSLFREYMDTLMKWGGRFCVIGNMNAVKYTCMRPRFRDGKVWLGATPRGHDFDTPDGPRSVNSVWFTNMDHKRRHEEMSLCKRFDPRLYPRFDNSPAIEVAQVKDIPCDYDGEMGVPITFLDKHCPEQFDIVGYLHEGKVDGVARYSRYLIRNRKPEPARRAA